MPKNALLLELTREQRADVLTAFNAAPIPEGRTRYQLLLLATDHPGSTTHVAALVHRSHDVVLRVFHRYRRGGFAAEHARAAVPDELSSTDAEPQLGGGMTTSNRSETFVDKENR